MRFDDSAAERESYAGAIRFGGEERLENEFCSFDRKPNARITDRNHQLPIFAPLRGYRERTALSFHGLYAVEYEVHENLLQLNAIRHRHRKLWVELGADRNGISIRIAALDSTTDIQRAVLLTVIFTSLRISELRRLRLTDIDLERAELHVCQRAGRYNADRETDARLSIS
jgi:integrase